MHARTHAHARYLTIRRRCSINASFFLAIDETILAASKTSRAACALRSTCGALLIGVPARGMFPRALRPARTVLCPARFTRRPARIENKKKFGLQSAIAVFVFSDSRCKNACKMLADLCPRCHRSPTKLCTDLVLVVHA